MPETYHIRIKQEYAAAIIEELQKKDALELIPESEAFEIPKWQQELVLSRIEKYKSNPELMLDEDTFFTLSKNLD